MQNKRLNSKSLGVTCLIGLSLGIPATMILPRFIASTEIVLQDMARRERNEKRQAENKKKGVTIPPINERPLLEPFVPTSRPGKPQ